MLGTKQSVAAAKSTSVTPATLIVGTGCIVGVSPDDGFVSSVSLAGFSTATSAAFAHSSDADMTYGQAIQMIPTVALGDIGTIRSADRVMVSKECGRRTRRRDRQEIHN